MEITYGELLLGVNERYSDELLVETTVDTAARGGATNVLSVEADAKASSVELLDGEADVMGKVNYRLLYLDSQGRLCGLDYFKDFKCRVKGEKIMPNGKCAVGFVVPDVDARVAGDGVELSAVVKVDLDYFGEEEKKIVTGISGAETLAGEVVTNRVSVKEKVLELDKIADVGLNVKKIVLFQTEALPLTLREEEDGTALAGEVKGTLLYLNDAEEVAELTVTLPFEEKAEAVGEKDYSAFVKSARVVLTDDEEGNSVEVEASVVLIEKTYDRLHQSVIVDSCGEKFVVEEQRQTGVHDLFFAKRTYSEEIEGAISVDDPGATYLFVRPGCLGIAGVSVADGKINVEGVASFYVVGEREDKYLSSRGELPFVFDLPFEGAKDNQRADVAVRVTDATISARGKEVRLKATLSVEVRLYEASAFSYLSDAKEGAPIWESEAGISVYYAEKGETLFSVAKSMGVLPSALVRANPFLSEPLEEDKKVLIFRQK